MRTLLCIGVVLVSSITASAKTPSGIRITVTNPRDVAAANSPVVLNVRELQEAQPAFDPAAQRAVLHVHEESGQWTPVPMQLDDLDGDGKLDEAALVLDLAPRQSRELVLTYGTEQQLAAVEVAFPNRAHARFEQKYEGIGWESDRVAWRLYFDPRNAVDLFGKRQHALALEYFAMPTVDYHTESPIGRDIYKNGDAVGIGSIAAWVEDKPLKVGEVASRQWKIRADGPVRAVVDLIYAGWSVGGRKVDLTSRLTIWAGHHGFWHHVSARGADGVKLITALPAKPGVASALQERPAGCYLTTWGHQVLGVGATATASLPDQNLGLALVFPGAPLERIAGPKDPNNHVAIVPVAADSDNLQGGYYVVAAWDQESPDGDAVPGIKPDHQLPAAVQSMQAWQRYLDNLCDQLASPIQVKIIIARD